MKLLCQNFLFSYKYRLWKIDHVTYNQNIAIEMLQKYFEDCQQWTNRYLTAQSFFLYENYLLILFPPDCCSTFKEK